MATHDKYDNDILKQLTRIANSLEKIEKSLILSPNESRPKCSVNLLRDHKGERNE